MTDQLDQYPASSEWTRDAPWRLRRGNYETTYSRLAHDGKAQTAHVRIPRKSFTGAAIEIAAQLKLADMNERGLVDVTRPSRRR